MHAGQAACIGSRNTAILIGWHKILTGFSPSVSYFLSFDWFFMTHPPTVGTPDPDVPPCAVNARLKPRRARLRARARSWSPLRRGNQPPNMIARSTSICARQFNNAPRLKGRRYIAICEGAYGCISRKGCGRGELRSCTAMRHRVTTGR